jgi:thymidylate kinase
VRDYAIIAVEGIDGSGKSTLIRSLERELSGSMVSRPCRKTVDAFRSMVESPADRAILYQHLLPDPFRAAAYHFEASVQFRYLHDEYSAHDVVIFDRWFQTWDVYCGPVDEHHEHFRSLRDRLPVPDVLFHVEVDPGTAYDRLVARQDRWLLAYSPAELRAKITALGERYREVMAREPGVVVLDGTQSAEKVLASALDSVRSRLGAGVA